MPIRSCRCVRAASWASTMLCRLRSVKRLKAGAGAARPVGLAGRFEDLTDLSPRRTSQLGFADDVVDEPVAEVGQGLGAPPRLADPGQVVGVGHLVVEAGDQIGKVEVACRRGFHRVVLSSEKGNERGDDLAGRGSVGLDLAPVGQHLVGCRLRRGSPEDRRDANQRHFGRAEPRHEACLLDLLRGVVAIAVVLVHLRRRQELELVVQPERLGRQPAREGELPDTQHASHPLAVGARCA